MQRREMSWPGRSQTRKRCLAMTRRPFSRLGPRSLLAVLCPPLARPWVTWREWGSRVILGQCSISPARRMGLRPLLLLLHVRVHCLVVKMKESGKSLWHMKSSFSCIALKVSSGTIASADRRVSTASKWFNAMRKARQSKTKRRVVWSDDSWNWELKQH